MKLLSEYKCHLILVYVNTQTWKDINYMRQTCGYNFNTNSAKQMALVVRRSLLVRTVWGSNPEQNLPHVANNSPLLQPWWVGPGALAQCRRDGNRSIVTPERVLSEYNEDLIFFWFHKTSTIELLKIAQNMYFIC